MGTRKIALITFEYPPTIGGAGIYAQDLYLALKKKDVTTKLILLNKDSNNSKNKLIDIFYLFRSFFTVYFCFFDDYDTIICNDGRAKKIFTFLSLIIPSKLMHKCVFVMHGGEIENFFINPSTNIKYLSIDKKAYNVLHKLKKIILVSENEHNKWVKFYPNLKDKFFIVPHGVSHDVFFKIPDDNLDTIKKKLGLKDEFIILSVSRLTEKKGQDTIIKALSLLKQNNSDLNIKLLIAGEGDYKNTLIKLVETLDLKNEVIFLGKIDRSKLKNYYNIANIFVLVSRYEESFGLVYIESLACGTPCISSTLGGVNDIIINETNGYKIEPLDYYELSKIIHHLYYNRNILDRMSNFSLNIYQEKYNLDNTVEILLKNT